MPLVGSPNRGYADWQRTSNYDSGVLYDLPPTALPSGVTSPVLDVSRYGYLGGQLQATNNIAECDIFWYADAAGTILLGQRTFFLTAAIAVPAQIRIPNLGPFVKIGLNSSIGPIATASARVFGTNRVHPLEFIPLRTFLIDVQAAVIPAGSTYVANPQDYCSGPAKLWILPGAAVTVTLNGLDFSVNPSPCYQRLGVGNTSFTDDLVIPAGGFYMSVQNTSGIAANYYFTVMQSMTGAL